MYRIRTKGYSKADQGKRWSLPDRVFFACGACHILAYAFLRRYGTPDMTAIWIKPDTGHIGNHIIVAAGEWAFDYHGYSGREHLLAHSFKQARRWWSGWDATLVELPAEVLVSEEKSRRIEGLWLREPKQFLHDALPRADAFLARFPAPPPSTIAKKPVPAKAGMMRKTIDPSRSFVGQPTKTYSGREPFDT